MEPEFKNDFQITFERFIVQFERLAAGRKEFESFFLNTDEGTNIHSRMNRFMSSHGVFDTFSRVISEGNINIRSIIVDFKKSALLYYANVDQYNTTGQVNALNETLVNKGVISLITDLISNYRGFRETLAGLEYVNEKFNLKILELTKNVIQLETTLKLTQDALTEIFTTAETKLIQLYN